MDNKMTNEKKTLIVIILTVITMIAEISTGYLSHSMALLADGLHMGTHAFALGITFAAYIFAKKIENSEKLGVLAGYTSSIILGLTGFWIIIESIERFIHPLQIGFNEAVLVALIGLVVNIISILIMGNHSHIHQHGHCHHHEDYNFKAAYLHILADVLTSVFAIIALLAAKFLGWTFLDPIIGIVGGVVILKWSYGLIVTTGAVLLDIKQS